MLFFTGADQLKLTALYGGTPFLTRLKERYINEKMVIAGAGAMALSSPVIYAGNIEVQEIGGAIKITTELEFERMFAMIRISSIPVVLYEWRR